MATRLSRAGGARRASAVRRGQCMACVMDAQGSASVRSGSEVICVTSVRRDTCLWTISVCVSDVRLMRYDLRNTFECLWDVLCCSRSVRWWLHWSFAGWSGCFRRIHRISELDRRRSCTVQPTVDSREPDRRGEGVCFTNQWVLLISWMKSLLNVYIHNRVWCLGSKGQIISWAQERKTWATSPIKSLRCCSRYHSHPHRIHGNWWWCCDVIPSVYFVGGECVWSQC